MARKSPATSCSTSPVLSVPKIFCVSKQKNKSCFASKNVNFWIFLKLTTEPPINSISLRYPTPQLNVLNLQGPNFWNIYWTQWYLLSWHDLNGHWRITLIKFIAVGVWCEVYVGYKAEDDEPTEWKLLILFSSVKINRFLWSQTGEILSKDFIFSVQNISDFSADVWKVVGIKFAHKRRSHSEQTLGSKRARKLNDILASRRT